MHKTLLESATSRIPREAPSILVRSAMAEDIAGMAQILVTGFALVPWLWMTPMMRAGIQADLQSRMGRKNSY